MYVGMCVCIYMTWVDKCLCKSSTQHVSLEKGMAKDSNEREGRSFYSVFFHIVQISTTSMNFILWFKEEIIAHEALSTVSAMWCQ